MSDAILYFINVSKYILYKILNIHNSRLKICKIFCEYWERMDEKEDYLIFQTRIRIYIQNTSLSISDYNIKRKNYFAFWL